MPVALPFSAFARLRTLLYAVFASLLLTACGQSWNNPYPAKDRGQNVLYTWFVERPRHLDPAVSFSPEEEDFTYQIYEMPVQYHYLKRPYELIPQLAEEVPQPTFIDKDGRELSGEFDPKSVAYSLYTIKVKKGIFFQPHQAFDAENRDLIDLQIGRITNLGDLHNVDTRELTADDFIYQIKRLASPRLSSPILGHMGEYIVGLSDYASFLRKEDTHIRNTQGKDAWLDLREHQLEGVKKLDKYTYQIKVKGVYPQFVYWLAMPFFTAIPWEADQFFSQRGLIERNITFDWYPVGTGPFMLIENDPNARMTLVKNPQFRGEPYPKEGEPGDGRAGLLADSGTPMPFLDRVVFTREKESIPLWNKFLQGYYDFSGISVDNFDQAIRVDVSGGAVLSPEMENRGVKLSAANTGLAAYMGFNHLDPVVGSTQTDPAARERAKKLRAALSLAFDWEEYIAIFLNGRGGLAQGPMPPGIFGTQDGEAGINPMVYEWIGNKPKKRSVETARRLLVEAGYPDGRDAKTGAPLLIYIDSTNSAQKAVLDWYRKQLGRINVQLEVRPTDGNRYQEKIRKGNTQLFFFGWKADYPDPENFLFLFYGPNAVVKTGGENKVNYSNTKYDRLFEKMKTMPNSPERLAIITQMVKILREDAAVAFAFNPRSYGLYHAWLGNFKPNHFAKGDLKYRKIDAKQRDAQRQQWNGPVVWPFVLFLLLIVGITIPAFKFWRERESAVIDIDDDSPTLLRTERHSVYIDEAPEPLTTRPHQWMPVVQGGDQTRRGDSGAFAPTDEGGVTMTIVRGHDATRIVPADDAAHEANVDNHSTLVRRKPSDGGE